MFGRKKHKVDTRIATGKRPKGISRREWENRRVEFVTSDGDMIWAGPASQMPRRLEVERRKRRRSK